MDRRGFVTAIAAVTASSVGPLSSLPALARTIPQDGFFDTPTSYVGSRFWLDDGSFLTLTSVNQLSARSDFLQMEALFEGGQHLSEGLYNLRAPGGASLALFLQSSDRKAIAIITKRVTSAPTSSRRA